MFTTLLSALGGAAGLGALLTPVLLHISGRRNSAQQLIDQLQQERDEAVRSRERSETSVAALWDYVLRLRWWLVKGSEGDPPTLPDGLSVAAVRARLEAGAA